MRRGRNEEGFTLQHAAASGESRRESGDLGDRVTWVRTYVAEQPRAGAAAAGRTEREAAELASRLHSDAMHLQQAQAQLGVVPPADGKQTAEGLRAVGGLTSLNDLYLAFCANVTDVGLWELRGRTALTRLYLRNTHVTDEGLQHLSCITALTTLYLGHTTTTQTGQDALTAALLALTIDWWSR